MTRRASETQQLGLDGLRLGAAQTMGAVRMVPVLREHAPGDLRIAIRKHKSAIGVAVVDGTPTDPETVYVSYVPHSFVVSYTKDGSEAAQGAVLGAERPSLVQVHHRIVKREAGEGATERYRLLPLHLAMEGFLALHFPGPDVLWSDYSEHAKTRGVDPRVETSTRGLWIRGMDAAVRTFEIHAEQVGVIVFVADALAAAFVVSHPEDYRRLHRTLLEQFYGELLYTYAMLYPDVPPMVATMELALARDLDELEAATAAARVAAVHEAERLATGLFGKRYAFERVRTSGSFVLERIVPVFDPKDECHIGERIVRSDGTLEYLQTYRLSAAQVRRAYLLETLANADWHIADAAKQLGSTKDELLKRLENAGFGYLLARHLRPREH